MKKVLLTVFAALVVFAASAQIEKGSWIVGGSSNLNFTSNDEDAGDYSEFNIDVKGGYFVIDNHDHLPDIVLYTIQSTAKSIFRLGFYFRL